MKIYANNNLVIDAADLVKKEDLLSSLEGLMSRLTSLEDQIAVLQGKIPCTSVTLNAASTILFNLDMTYTLTPTLLPADTTDVCEWYSDNKEVATVENGIVTPVGEGDCTITVICGRAFAICSVGVRIVTEPEAPPVDDEILCQGIQITPSVSFNTLNYARKLDIILTPKDTTESVIWTSTAPSIAEVNSSGMVYARSNGECYIMARCGSWTARCAVVVNAPVSVDTSCTSIKLDRTAVTFTDLRNFITLMVTLTPTDTTDLVSWRSTNTNVATVDHGTVKPVSNGACDIIAQCGTKQAVCRVYVDITS